jgi:hypothetical protein
MCRRGENGLFWERSTQLRRSSDSRVVCAQPDPVLAVKCALRDCFGQDATTSRKEVMRL